MLSPLQETLLAELTPLEELPRYLPWLHPYAAKDCAWRRCFSVLERVETKLCSLPKEGLAKVQEVFDQFLDSMIRLKFTITSPCEHLDPIHAAVVGDYPLILRSLVSRGGSLNKHNLYGNTYLYEAAFRDLIGIAHFLIAHGADISLSNVRGTQIPLHAAHSTAMCKLLISHGCDINTPSTEKGYESALHRAAREGASYRIFTLLALGAIDFTPPEGESALDVAKKVHARIYHQERSFPRSPSWVTQLVITLLTTDRETLLKTPYASFESRAQGTV